MASDEDIQAKVLADADQFGRRAAREEPAQQIPSGTGVYLVGFFNGLLLAQSAPAVAAEVLQVLNEGVDEKASVDRKIRITNNQRDWIDEWRQLLG